VERMRESRDNETEGTKTRAGQERRSAEIETPTWLPMAGKDLTEVAELEKLCFVDPWSRASFAAELTAGSVSWCRVMRIGGRLVAYLIAWFVEDEAHLANIAVAPSVRRNGLAQGMLDRLYRESYLRGSRIIVLEVRASNEGALRLYERNGFVRGGIRSNYYSHPPEDAQVMIRSMEMRE